MNIYQVIFQIAFFTPPLLFALSLHEFAHAYSAYKLGDPTAKMMGRLTLDPFKHIDIIGLIMLFLVHIGWAKPVPVNYSRLKNPKRDAVIVAFAGPGINLFSAVLGGLIYRYTVNLNLPKYLDVLNNMLLIFVLISLILAFFNLIPVPPLDGWRIVSAYSDPSKLRVYETYGIFLLILLFFSPYIIGVDLLGIYLRPLVGISTKLIIGVDLSKYFI